MQYSFFGGKLYIFIFMVYMHMHVLLLVQCENRFTIINTFVIYVCPDFYFKSLYQN